MSSATITPAEIQCCGPLGSTRYYRVKIVGITGTCPECHYICICDGINGEYFMDTVFSDLNGPCQSQLQLTGICGYYLLNLYLTPCVDGRVRYSVFL